MLSSRVVGFLCSRNFTKSSNLSSRFTREGLRDRLKHQEIKEIAKNRDLISSRRSAQNVFSIPPPDARSVRPISHLWRALNFTLVTGATSYTIAIIAEYFTREKEKPDNIYKIVKKMFVYPDESKIRIEAASIQNYQLTPGEKSIALLIGMNAIVFLMWKVKNLAPIMQKYFTNSFASKSLCPPMLLSAFSHTSFIHFALNMYVTTTFATKIIDNYLGVEQFWAFYVTSAVVSSFVSLADKAVRRTPIRALGASGAILAMLTYTCMQIPEARLSLIFVPGFDFSAQHAIIGIIAFDLIGLLFRFRLFDHAAHLGGSLFGVGYALMGQHLIWDCYGEWIETWLEKNKKM